MTSTLFLLDLFNLYNETNRRELEVLKGFTIYGCRLNIRYAEDSMLMSDTERKLLEIFVVIQSGKKGDLRRL